MPTVRPARVEAVAAALGWAQERGLRVVTSASPPAGAGEEGFVLSVAGLRGALSSNPDSGTVRVEAGVSGAELAWQLHREGRCLWPRPAPFFREPLGPYLAGPGLAGEFVAFSIWESPLMALEAALRNGRVLRAGVAPRSAAGPDYRAFLLGMSDRVGVITSAIWRTVDRSVIALSAARFDSSSAALSAARAHCAMGWRPFAGRIARANEDGGWREPPGAGAVQLLLAHRAEGPRADLLRDQLDRAVRAEGGIPLPSRAARAWHEQSFVDLCQRGSGAVADAGPARADGQLASARVAVPWHQAQALWSTVEAAGRRGPLGFDLSAEGPRPEGIILHIRLCRRGRSRIGLERALERLVGAVAEGGGALVGLHGSAGRPLPPPASATPAHQLLDAVVARLGPAPAERGTAAPGEG
jgi:FAD/FMN-containing dehydrogenase